MKDSKQYQRPPTFPGSRKRRNGLVPGTLRPASGQFPDLRHQREPRLHGKTSIIIIIVIITGHNGPML